MSGAVRPAALSVAAALAFLLVSCGGSSGPAGQAGPEESHGEDHAAPEEVAEPVEGAPEVSVTALDIDFEPDTLELTAGEPVNVTVVNDGRILHDFTLEAAGVHVNVEPGKSATTAVTVDEPGSYRAICTVPGHEDAGMVIDVEVQ